MAASSVMWLLFLMVCGSDGLSVPRPSPTQTQRQGTLTPELLAQILSQQRNAQTMIPTESRDWPSKDVKLGEVSGVDVAPSGEVLVFHRGNRPWTKETFDEYNVMPENQRINISDDAIVRLNAATGQLIDSFGDNMFYVPHGLTVDKDGNIWLTDVGRHQVLRIPKGKQEPDLVLGEMFVPGSDDNHFCKPTDVAVAENGEFFVSDGYCNSRILKFSKEGQLIGKWGVEQSTQAAGWQDSPYNLDVPHSLALVEDQDLICVADREDQRALCYYAGLRDPTLVGQFALDLVPEGEVGQVYGLAYDKTDDVMYVAALLAEKPVEVDGNSFSPARVFTYDLQGNYLSGWGFITEDEALRGPSIPHDIAVSPSGREIYIADLLQHTVRKFIKDLPDTPPSDGKAE